MAIVTFEAKLRQGLRLLCVDKNAVANLSASFSVGNYNRPIQPTNGFIIYPGVLGIRRYRVTVDLEAKASVARTEERYKTYGGGNNVISSEGIDNTNNWKVTSSLICKFPTYIEIDVEKLNLPEGTDCIIQFDEGFVVEDKGRLLPSGAYEYPDIIQGAPSPANPSFFSFRTPWYGLSFMNVSANIGSLTNYRTRYFTSDSNSLFTPLFTVKANKAGFIELDALSSVYAFYGRKRPFASLMNARFGPIGPGDTPYLEGNGYDYETGLGEWYNDFPGITRIRQGESTNNEIISTFTLPEFLIVLFADSTMNSTTEMSAEGLHRIGIISQQQAVATSTIEPVKTSRITKNLQATASISLPLINRTRPQSALITATSSLSVNFNRIVPSAITTGLNNYGQLGLGDTTNRNTFTFVSEDWDVVSAGEFHSVGIKNGKLYAWGLNSSGELGQGDTIGSSSSPLQVGTDEDWVFVAAGGRWNIAKKSNGTLWSWGQNSNGQLGLGDQTTRTVPTQIGSVNIWDKVGAANGHCLATRTDGTLWVWGDNNSGNLGLGEFRDGGFIRLRELSPVRLGTATNWTFVSAGLGSSFAINTSGQLYAWGSNTTGQLGLSNTTSPVWTPVEVGGTGWQSIATGGLTGPLVFPHTLAIRNGELYATGGNNYGQLGLSDSTNRTAFTKVGSFTDWNRIDVGKVSGHSLAIRGGRLYAWGQNDTGQLGLLDNSNRNAPTQVGSLTFWLDVSGGRGHSISRGPGIV